MKILVQTDEPCGVCAGTGVIPNKGPGISLGYPCGICQSTGHKLEWVDLERITGNKDLVDPDPFGRKKPMTQERLDNVERNGWP